MIALSLMALIGIVSAGMSASLVTYIGRAEGHGGKAELSRLATGASLIAIAWGSVVLVLLVPAALMADWADLLNLSSATDPEDVAYLIAALLGLLAVSLPISIPRNIMIGRMHGYIAHVTDVIGITAGAIFLVAALALGAPLWALGIAFAAPPVVVSLVAGVSYLRHYGISQYSPSSLDRETVVSLWRDSIRMMGYQASYAVSSQSDLLLIGVVLGAPAGAVYGLAQRVFSLPIMTAYAVNQAQWPAMAKMDASGDQSGVRGMFLKTLGVCSIVATSLALLISYFYEPLTKAWLGKTVETDRVLLLGMVAWVCVSTLANSMDSVLRARHETTYLMRAMMAMAIINVCSTLILLPILGAAGAVWGSVAGFAIGLIVPHTSKLRKLFASSSPAAHGSKL